MASHTIVDFLTDLYESEQRDELCFLIAQQLDKSPLAERVTEEFSYVLKSLFKTIQFNQSTTHFEPGFLKRVVAKFRTDPEVQTLELQILDAILVHGQKMCGFTSAKVPAIIRIRRDKPILRPDTLLLGNAAAKLCDILQREVNRPSSLPSNDHLRGRLLLYLFFLARVETLEQAIHVLAAAPPLLYAEGLVYLEFEYKGQLCRYVLPDPAALLWMQWLRAQPRGAVSGARPAIFYVNLYLSGLSDWRHDAIGVSKLRLLRKIDYTLRYSPIAYGLYTGYLPSQLLNPETFVRLVTDRCVPSGGVIESVNQDLLTVREKRAWKCRLHQERYSTVTAQLSELKRIMSVLRPPPGKSANAPLAISRSSLVNGFTDWLEQHATSDAPYLWFLVAWARSLFKHGGRVKRSLKPGTIVDYVSTIGAAFLGNFNGYRLSELDGVDWVELLNRTSDEVKSPSRKGFVLYFATFLRDAELVPELPVAELDIAVSHGEVDANLMSVSHAEAILGWLNEQQDLVARDAHLLFCLCFFSGLRRSEAAFLQLADLDFLAMEPSHNTYDYIDLHIRRNQKRGLKSTAANRVLPLDALWPAPHLSKLRARVQYLRARGDSPTAPVFESLDRTEQAYRLITDLMHQYTGDRTLRVHHLRHSFANWTWFRLNSDLLQVGRRQLGMFQGEFFSDAALQHLYRRLGFRGYSRKGQYVLCHLLGHEEPTTTIGSYLHLKDIAGYLALGARELSPKKLLNHTLGRSSLVVRKDVGENLAERLTYENREIERLVAPVSPPVLANSSLASVKTLQHCFEVSSCCRQLQVLDWAAILMACQVSSAEQVAYQEGVSPAMVRALLDHAAIVQKHCPRQGKRLPLIPALSPWIHRLVERERRQGEQRQAPQAIEEQQLSKVKRDSYSLQILNFLFRQLQTGLDDGSLTWPMIQDGCQILRYLVPGKGYLIRSPSSRRVIQFLTLCRALGFKARHIQLTLQLPGAEVMQKTHILGQWNGLLQSAGLAGVPIDEGKQQDWPYLPKHDGLGVMEVRLLNSKLGGRGRRQRAFLSMMQLMLILSATLKPL